MSEHSEVKTPESAKKTFKLPQSARKSAPDPRRPTIGAPKVPSGFARATHDGLSSLPKLEPPERSRSLPDGARAAHSKREQSVLGAPVEPEIPLKTSPVDIADSTSSPQRRSPQSSPRSPAHANIIPTATPSHTTRSPSVADSVIPDSKSQSLSWQSFCDTIKKYAQSIRDEHEYQVKHSLKSSRKLSQAKQVNVRIPPKTVQRTSKKISPFLGSESIKIEASNARYQKSKVGKLAQAQNKGSKPGADDPRGYEITVYKDSAEPVPGYAHFTSIRHNVLVEDEKHRTHMPWQGDDAEVQDLDEDKRQVEAMIERNQRMLHQLNEVTEKARPWVPWIPDMLKELGCDIDSVLRYLMTDDSSLSVPEGVPDAYRVAWSDRRAFLQEGYYSSGSEPDASDDEGKKRPRKPKRQWRDALESIPSGTNPRNHAAAGLACIAFREVVGFSLWNVARVIYTSQDPSAGRSRDKARSGLEQLAITTEDDEGVAEMVQSTPHGNTWQETTCIICKQHDCPLHGEFEDTAEMDNKRVRVGFWAPTEEVENGAYGLGKHRILPLVEYIGTNHDGIVTGNDWPSSSGSSRVLEDIDFCEDDCFWIKSQRPLSAETANSKWSTEDEHLFESMLPAYAEDRRGPCLLARSGMFDKSCMEIFQKLVAKDTGHTAHKDRSSTVSNHHKKSTDYWQEHFPHATKLEQREVFYPCSHSGPCNYDNCRCFNQGVTCEKSCACSSDCPRRFQGCNCSTRGAKVCLSDRCQCYAMNRECSPDLCQGCGSHEVLDPANRHRDDMARGRCQNVAIQRGVPKPTLVGISKLLFQGGKFGYGLYLGEACKKDDFVGEYTGEVLSERETEMRGFIYDTVEMSYLFTLNKSQVLDSMVFGNKMRFINDQNEGMANCRPRALLCNSTTRIGMFAQRDIDVGEELFFDYGPDFRKKFDLIKSRPDGGVTTVKRDTSNASAALAAQANSKVKANMKHGSSGKAKDVVVRPTGKGGKPITLTKNGKRVGRPPKSAQKRRWSEAALEEDDRIRVADVESDAEWMDILT